MIFFFLQKALRNEERHIYILNSGFLKAAVQLMLDVLPDCITSRFDDHAALYACVVTQLCFFYHIRIPLGEILVHGCDGFY